MVVCNFFFFIIFFLQFMSFLTVLTVKNSHILTGIFFIFLKERLRPNSKSCKTIFGPQRKDRKSSYHVRQISALFCKLVALNLGQNCVKDIKVTKIVKQIKFQGTWAILEAKNYFQRQPRTKYLRKTLAFLWNRALREKFNFYFQGVFC